MSAKGKAAAESVAAGPQPGREVKPEDYTFIEVFSDNEDVNSLQIDYALLTNKISDWIDVRVTREAVMDELSEFLLESFTTLLETYEPPPPSRGKIFTKLTITDVLNVKNILKTKIRPGLDQLDLLKDTAKYTEFCSNFLGKMTCVDARAILEVLDPDKQCIPLVEEKKFCWICGLKLNNAPKPECEHILPISDALLHLNLYQNKSSLERLNKYEVNMLKLEYLWSHQCCNQSKNNLKYIRTDGDKYSVNTQGIDLTIERIQNNAKPGDDGSYDCYDIFGKYEKKGKAPALEKYKHLNTGRISTYIDPIVNTINLHIAYLRKRGMMDQQKAFLVYEYLILIRFFSRIPGCTLVESFKKYYLSDDPIVRAAAEAEEKRIKEEIAKAKAIKLEAAVEREARAAAERAKKAEAPALKQKAESEALKLAISGGQSRAQRYAAKMKTNGTDENDHYKQSKGLADAIKQITTDDDTVKAGITTAEIIDDTLSVIVTTTSMEGGAGKPARRLTTDYAPNDRVFQTLASSRAQRYKDRQARIDIVDRLKINEKTIRTRIYDMYNSIGSELNSLLASKEASIGNIFTKQDVDNLHILCTIHEIERERLPSYDKKDGDIDRILDVQARLERTIGMGVLDEKLGGAYPNNETTLQFDPYAIIQNDFTTEKAFVFLSAYYPVYLRMNNLKHLTADQYMSTPHILRDTLTYFGADLAEYSTLLMNHLPRVAVSTLQPTVLVVPTQPKRSVVSTAQSPKNIAKLMAALGRRPQYQIDSKSQFEAPLRQGMVGGGKRRTKKCRVIKRRTRKHKKN